MTALPETAWTGSDRVTLTAAAGRLLTARVILISSSSNTITPPSGWTVKNTRTWTVAGLYPSRDTIYQKTATGSEGTQIWSGTNVLAINVFVESWTGADVSVGIEASTALTASEPVSTSQSFGSVTSLTPNATIAVIGYQGDPSGTAPGTVWPYVGPTGFTYVAGSVYDGLAYKIQPTAGATGALSVTVDSDLSAFGGWTVSIKAAVFSVTPNNAAHSHSAASPTLAQKSTVTANSGAHAHSATSPTIAAGAAASVTPDDAAHAHSATSPTLAANSTLAVNDAAHAHSATSPTLAANSTVTAANAAHAHTAGSPTLAATSTVAPADAMHAHSAGSPTLAAQFTVTPANATHGHTAEQPSIAAGGSLAVDGALHDHTASSPTLAFATTVTASSAAHAHTATSPTLAANDNAVHPDNATHAHWATSPVLVSTPLDVPGYTDPLSIEGGGSVVRGSINGGGSVVAGSITSTGRVVAGSIRGRP